MMWIEFEWQTSLSAKTPETRQHFCYFFGVEFAGFDSIESWNRWQAFFLFFYSKMERVVINALAK
jgi:hypothetical protein